MEVDAREKEASPGRASSRLIVLRGSQSVNRVRLSQCQTVWLV
jgi:hypothetical protein